MKVKELIENLLQIDQELEVIIASDSEGNNFGPFEGFGLGMYVPETTWYGSFKGADDCEWEEIKYKENAVAFWPVN